MDEVYSLLTTVDFLRSITDGLRRNTDVLRNVLESGRGGDLTMGIRYDSDAPGAADSRPGWRTSGRPLT